jgi:hypothetical protein
MRSLFLAMLALLLISGLALSHCWPVEQTEQTSNSLSKYLHQRRLPLVEARVIPRPGGTRTLLLYGFVATELGNQDAENQALDFLADPDIEITNLIKITPELLGLNSPNDGAALVSSDASTTDQSATDKSTAELGSLGDENAADSPAAIADREAYASQALNNELLLSNGTIPVFSPTLILGSRAFVQPSFIYYAYCFPHTLSHVALYPPDLLIRGVRDDGRTLTLDRDYVRRGIRELSKELIELEPLARARRGVAPTAALARHHREPGA